MLSVFYANKFNAKFTANWKKPYAKNKQTNFGAVSK